MPMIERSASRSQIKQRYASNHQQPQNDSRSDELDPFLIVGEPSVHTIHGQPTSGYPCSRTAHIITFTANVPSLHLRPTNKVRARCCWLRRDHWSEEA